MADDHTIPNSKNYIDGFRNNFQVILDAVADGRIEMHARHVAVKTAASPYALVDALVTVHGGFSMLADLCRIYNLRVSPLATAVLTARIFFNSYVAGRVDEAELVNEQNIRKVVEEMKPIEGFLEKVGVDLGRHATDATAQAATGVVTHAATGAADAASGIGDAVAARILGKLGAG